MVWQYKPGLLAIDLGRMWYKMPNGRVDWSEARLHIVPGAVPASAVERALLLERYRMQWEMFLQWASIEGEVEFWWEP